jgi:hypothetical protein
MFHALLATSPFMFAASHDIIMYQNFEPRQPYAMTNRGLRIDLALTKRGQDTYVAALYCTVPSSFTDSNYLGVVLKRLSVWDDRYARTNIGMLEKGIRPGRKETVYVSQRNINLAESERILRIISATSDSFLLLLCTNCGKCPAHQIQKVYLEVLRLALPD